MKDYCYLVPFVTGLVERVWAGNEKEAIILAQAAQIEKGNQYKVVHSKIRILDL